MSDKYGPFENKPEVLDSDRYQIGSQIGKGSMGTVYAALDTYLNHLVAIKVADPTPKAKEELQRLGLDEERILKREASVREGSSYIVNRDFGRDKNNKPFVVMPFYPKSLEDKICSRGFFSEDEKGEYKVLSDIARGLQELHTSYEVIHGDLKPSNILIDKRGNYRLTDFSNARKSDKLTPFFATVTQRDNTGFRHTRAPECWSYGENKGESPSTRSDIYGFGALAYKLLSGHYPLEDELAAAEKQNGQEGMGKLIKSLDKDTWNKKMRRQVRMTIPRNWRHVIGKCLDYDPYSRFYDGESLIKEVNAIIESADATRATLKSLRLWGPVLGIPALVATGVLHTLASFDVEQRDPGYPQLKSTGPLSTGFYVTEYNPKKFDRETLSLPQVSPHLGVALIPKGYVMENSPNKLVSYLANNYLEAELKITQANSGSYSTQFQKDLWKKENPSKEAIKRGTDQLDIVINSVKYGLEKAERPNGVVDLEDCLVISRIGEESWKKLIAASGSKNYKEYRAKLPEKEREFIENWLGYINF